MQHNCSVQKFVDGKEKDNLEGKLGFGSMSSPTQKLLPFPLSGHKQRDLIVTIDKFTAEV